MTKIVYCSEKMTIFSSSISSEPLIVGSLAIPYFNRKTQVMGSSSIEVQHFESQKFLKMSIFDIQWS